MLTGIIHDIVDAGPEFRLYALFTLSKLSWRILLDGLQISRVRTITDLAGRSRVLRLPGLAPLQAPQSARREDEGEHRSYAERVKRPDEQEGSAGLGDLAAKNASRSHHVDDRHGQPKERPDEHDDVPRPPFGKHQRSVQPTRMGTATRVEPPAWAVPTLAWRVSSAR